MDLEFLKKVLELVVKNTRGRKTLCDSFVEIYGIRMEYVLKQLPRAERRVWRGKSE